MTRLRSVESLDQIEFETCAECGVKWTAGTLKAGHCWDCADKREAAAIAQRTSAANRERSKRHFVLHTSGAPKKVYSKPFDLKGAPWPGNLDRWEGEPWSVFLHGLTGPGKTFLACELLYRLGGGFFVDVQHLPERAIAGDLPALRRARVLVLDEVGRGLNGKAREYLVGLVRDRENELAPTVLTSQLSLAGLLEAGQDASMVDRLKPGLVVPVKGGSRR